MSAGRQRSLTNEQALEAYRRYQKGARAVKLAEELGTTEQTLYNYFKRIRTGKLKCPGQ